jgi:hypothetical protein
VKASANKHENIQPAPQLYLLAHPCPPGVPPPPPPHTIWARAFASSESGDEGAELPSESWSSVQIPGPEGGRWGLLSPLKDGGELVVVVGVVADVRPEGGSVPSGPNRLSTEKGRLLAEDVEVEEGSGGGSSAV